MGVVCFGRVCDSVFFHLSRTLTLTPSFFKAHATHVPTETMCHRDARLVAIAGARKQFGVEIRGEVLEQGSLRGCREPSAGCIGRIAKAQCLGSTDLQH